MEHLLQFYFDEAEFKVVHIGDVVRHPGRAGVRQPHRQLHLAHAAGLLQTQYAGGQRHDDVVHGVHVEAGVGEGRFAIPQQIAAWIEGIARRRSTVVVAFGNPYVIGQFPSVNSYLVTYGVGDDLERAAARALLGEQKITGRTPVSLPGFFKSGDGIQRPN